MIFGLKRWLIPIAGNVFVVLAFVLPLFFGFDLLSSLAIALGAAITSAIFQKVFMDTTFSLLTDGAGIGVLVIDSTGVILPVVAKYNRPDIFAQIGKQKTQTMYAREMVSHFSMPKPGNAFEFQANGDDYIGIAIKKKDVQDSKFSFMNIPFIAYNSVKDFFYSKSMLSNLESSSNLHHSLLYLNRRVDDILSIHRDQQRYVADQYRRKTNFWESPVFIWIIIIIAGIIGLYVAWPTISKLIGGAAPVVGAIADSPNVVGTAVR